MPLQKWLLLGNGSISTPVARLWLCKCHVKAAADTHAVIEELLGAVFYVSSVSI
jgi:hypothetical protein